MHRNINNLKAKIIYFCLFCPILSLKPQIYCCEKASWLQQLSKKTFNCGGLLRVHYHHARKPGSMQAGMALEIKVLPFSLAHNRHMTDTLASSLSIGNLKIYPYSKTFPPTRSYLLEKQSVTLNNAIHCEIMWGNHPNYISLPDSHKLVTIS